MLKDATFEGQIRKTRKKISANLGELAGEALQESFCRLAYLDQLIHKERQENRMSSPRVFLSFAGDGGQGLIQDIYPALRGLKVPQSGKRFEVVTGMAESGKPLVMQHIVSKIERCSIFFGILTKEHNISVTDDEGGNYAPGAWVLLEAGMAIGLGLRVVFFVEDGVHKSFWLGSMGHWRHAKFDRNSYQPGLKLATTLVLEHYNELTKTIPSSASS